MEKYEVMKIRRIALKWTKEKLATEAGIDPRYIDFYEDGKLIGRDFEYKISNTLFKATKALDCMDHRRFRIAELSMKIQVETDTDKLVKLLAHMTAECGKFQMDLMDEDEFLQT